MRVRGRKFELDRADGKFLGVCSGLANMTNVDATIIRIGLVLATLMVFPWPALAYFLAAWLGKPNGAGGRGRGRLTASEDGAAERMRDMDRRMAQIETYVASPNRQLAQEIDSLR